MAHDLRQEALPRLSSKYFNFADAAALQTLGRHFWVGGIEQRAKDGLIMLNYPTNGEEALTGLKLLLSLRKIPTLEGKRLGITVANTITVARAGGLAVRQVHNRAQRLGVQLSDSALEGIRHELLDVHGRIQDTYEPLVRPVPRDREAQFFLAAAGKILGVEERLH